MKIFSFRDVCEGREQMTSADFINDYDLCNPSIDCSGDPVITKQNFADECNINVIMSRYESSGVVSFLNRNEPHYGECTAIELADALNTVIQAETMFGELPAKIRSEFSNDPVEFLAAIDDESKHDRLRELGVMKPKETVLSPSDNTVSEAVKPPTGGATVVSGG